jgi:hypothetical protein
MILVIIFHEFGDSDGFGLEREWKSLSEPKSVSNRWETNAKSFVVGWKTVRHIVVRYKFYVLLLLSAYRPP